LQHPRFLHLPHFVVRYCAPQPGAATAAVSDDDDDDKDLSQKPLHYCHNIGDLASRRGQVLTLDQLICCSSNCHQVAKYEKEIDTH